MGALGFVFAFLGRTPCQGRCGYHLYPSWEDALCKRPGYDLHADWAYGVSQVFSELDNFRKPQNKEICTDIGKIFPPMKKILSMWKIIFSSLGIGTLIGAIPGTGASIAVFMSRNAASNICEHSKGKLDMPGTGCLEGVFAPEVANNAVTGGALIPALSLGIPGDSAT
ncbi:tripartite tricarboxylate transporter permease, partial [Enterocloster sp.]|uniref:tripartite tricarboxylate transporter permease n=1 Tax=Enterocloster sp. TaxID=2719315 RepID=UPI00399F59C8